MTHSTVAQGRQLHPFNSGEAATLTASPERAKRVERETSLDVSVLLRLLQQKWLEITRPARAPIMGPSFSVPQSGMAPPLPAFATLRRGERSE